MLIANEILLLGLVGNNVPAGHRSPVAAYAVVAAAVVFVGAWFVLRAIRTRKR